MLKFIVQRLLIYFDKMIKLSRLNNQMKGRTENETDFTDLISTSIFPAFGLPNFECEKGYNTFDPQKINYIQETKKVGSIFPTLIQTGEKSS